MNGGEDFAPGGGDRAQLRLQFPDPSAQGVGVRPQVGGLGVQPYFGQRCW